MRNRPHLVTALLAALLLAAPALPGGTSEAAAAPAPDSYAPSTGALFNNPTGREVARRRLFRHIIRTVDSVPPRGTIRFAVYSFADKATADALLRAHARGVSVKLIFSGKNVYKPMTRMRKALGSNPRADSFAIFCEKSCRGSEGQMHAKFFQFSEAGGVPKITMVGSNNLTRHNAEDQWSDLYTVVRSRRVFRIHRKWFGQLRWDRPVKQPYVRTMAGRHLVQITPVAPDSLAKDPLYRALSSIGCRGGREQKFRTRIRIATHAWNEDRGRALAHKVAKLKGAGCRIKVVYGVGVGPGVRMILEDAGVRMTNGTHRGVHTHEKLLIVHGTVGGKPNRIRVWTGSHNWSDPAFRRDDLLLRINRKFVGRQYVKAFEHMWANG